MAERIALVAAALFAAAAFGVLAALGAARVSTVRKVAVATRRATHASRGVQNVAWRADRMRTVIEQMLDAVAPPQWNREVLHHRFWLAVAGSAAGAPAAILFGSAAIGFAAGVAVVLVAIQLLRSRSAREVERWRSQLPVLFTGLASSVGAGLSLAQAFERAETTCDGSLALQLRELNGAVALGTPLVEALDRFAEQSQVPELRAAVVGLGVQHTAGGGLVRILDHATFQLKQGDALQRSIRSHTAQGRMTIRMVTFVPLGLSALMAAFSDDYLAVFTGTPAGRSLLALAILLEVLGAFGVSRLLRVEV